MRLITRPRVPIRPNVAVSAVLDPVRFAMGVSQMTKSVALARAMGLIGLAVLVVLGSLTGAETIQEHAPLLLESLHLMFPKAYKLELWRPDLLERVPSIVMLLGLGSLYFALGHIKLARGDA